MLPFCSGMKSNGDLIKSIKSIDFGQEYGNQGLVREIAYAHNTKELTPLIEDITMSFDMRDTLSIGDWGGGNGILAKDLYQRLQNELHITVIDLDDTKFSAGTRHANVKADILAYKPGIRFDYSLSRNVLHYLTPEQQAKFMGNIFDNTRFGVLLINYTYDEQERKRRRELERLLKENTGVERHYMTCEELVTLVRKNGWEIKKDATYIIKDFDYESFFRDRFGLEDQILLSLRQTGLLERSDYETTVFYCKPS